jgi:hypothetical protein
MAAPTITCRDADVWIRPANGAEELTVNGKGYGRLNPGDGVLVDHGVVSIERNPNKPIDY